MCKRGVVAAIGIIMILSVLSISTIQPIATAQFVIASWEWPSDQYGQGLYQFEIFENSTGSWIKVYQYDYYESMTFYWNASIGIKLRCWSTFNSTLTGAASASEGKNYQRHNVSVVRGGETIFSQQNFTFYEYNTANHPMWIYGYDVILGFLPIGGAVYTIIVRYQIYGYW